MPKLSNWLKKSAEKLTEVLLGADLQSRLHAYIDMVCAQRSDNLLPTRFRIEMDQTLFYQKIEEYRNQTGNDLPQLEEELAEAARAHILGKGVNYRTYADTIVVKIEPHVMTNGLKIIGDFPKEKQDATPITSNAVARSQRPDDQKLETVARPVATTFDSRSLETVVQKPDKPLALETRVFDPSSDNDPEPDSGLETRVVDQDSKDSQDTGLETRVVTPETSPSESTGMETQIWSPQDTAGDQTSSDDDDDDALRTQVFTPDSSRDDTTSPDGTVPPDEMATVVEVPTRILFRVVLLEPDENNDYSETESWMLELGKTYSIGRSHTNDIVIDSRTISRKHAELSVTPDGTVLLSDAGSSHGTYLNSVKIEEPSPIDVGDDIQLTRLGAAHLALQPMQLQ